MRRRDFLASLGVTGLAFAAGPLRALARGRPRSGGRDLVPGQVVRVPWPGRATILVHAYGSTETRVPAPAPVGVLMPRIDVVAMPPDGRLPAGRHDFFLEGPDGRAWLGGYDVAPFRFGC